MSLLGPALRIAAKAPGPEAFGLSLEDRAMAPPPGHAVVEVVAAGVNPSDVKATMGIMPKAIFPRTPGRDFAGTVVAGPAEWLGRQVWGSGGDVGITRDGSHARHLALPVEALYEKPANLSLQQAAAVGVPFVTAAVGFAEAGGVKPGSLVLVHGANGRVGQAACQIAMAAGARVIGAVRREEARAAVPAGVDIVVGQAGPVHADLVFNTIGSAVFADANAAMGHGATQILIATQSRAVDFDILAFYRGRHRFVGVDTLALTASQTGAVLESLRPDFERGALLPYELDPACIFPLSAADAAYRLVHAGSPARVLFDMEA